MPFVGWSLPDPSRGRIPAAFATLAGLFLHTYDLDAFKKNVLKPLCSSGPLSIVRRIFDHRADAPVSDSPIEVATDAIVIVEGMFLHRDELAGSWDMSVFLKVPFAVPVRRLSERDGSNPDPGHDSNARYVEGQRIYLSRCHPERRATHVADNS